MRPSRAAGQGGVHRGVRLLAARGVSGLSGELPLFRVGPFEPNRVWFDTRFKGTHTGPLAGGRSKPRGRRWSAAAGLSMTFNERGECTELTVGYVMDKNTATPAARRRLRHPLRDRVRSPPGGATYHKAGVLGVDGYR